MSVLEHKCDALDLMISLKKDVLAKILEVGRQHLPNEFGGLLVGHYDDDVHTAHITNIILPVEFKSTKTSFLRETKGLENTLISSYNLNPPEMYLGEWHTHPYSEAIPSFTDVRTLKMLSESNSVLIENPLMMIVGLDAQTSNYKFYVIDKQKLYSYE